MIGKRTVIEIYILILGIFVGSSLTYGDEIPSEKLVKIERKLDELEDRVEENSNDKGYYERVLIESKDIYDKGVETNRHTFDRVLDQVYWIIGLIISIALGLLGLFSWKGNERLKREREEINQELKDTKASIKEESAKGIEAVNKKLKEVEEKAKKIEKIALEADYNRRLIEIVIMTDIEELKINHTDNDVTSEEEKISKDNLRRKKYEKLKKLEIEIEDKNLSKEFRINLYKHIFNTSDDYREKINYTNKCIELDSKNAEHYYVRGHVKVRKRNFEEALKDLGEAIELDGRNSIFYHNRGILKMEMGKYEESIEDFTKAIKLKETGMSYGARGYARLETGRCKKESGEKEEGIKDFTEAIEDLNKAIELDNNKSEYYFDRGLVITELENYEEALKDLDKAIEMNPENGMYHSSRGNVKIELEDYEEGIEDLDKAIKINPTNDNYYRRGFAKIKLRRYEKGIEDLDKAIELNSKDGSYYYRRGFAKVELGRYNEGIEDYKKVKELIGQIKAMITKEKYNDLLKFLNKKKDRSEFEEELLTNYQSIFTIIDKK